ncbi:hypothetical protein [Sphingomicrobium nitratireducens]|uniref:hypothetical protein n=1 Tax=Sphingomicrobium nitratireducens TaxID=2964666 RepID=UPI00223F94A6|nr:hypothetical protein [Sphingomicrobium nitratireducens]
MSLLAAYVASCLLLVVAAERLRIIPLTRTLLARMREAFAVLRSTMSDEEKEKAVQRAALQLLIRTVTLSLALVVVFGAAAAPVILGDVRGWFSPTEFLSFTIHPLVVVGTIAVAAAPWAWRKVARRAA